ncbi:helix-turn-helix transcriptional regulator [Paracoccus pacificus]|uniref:Helix-turn-helix transcriptional regulator n=1 Tax=Paracoccus pacificus TaxID=1463598 RepID=A0ABW4R3Y7_9RHOB
MARTDRLMRLMDTLRRLPAPVTAERLGRETGVSQRQLYRDIATLRAGGALIDGEAGVGYRLVEDSALPPQSFSRLEIEALLMAVAQLSHMGDDELSLAGQDALARIIATLPERQALHAMHKIMHSYRPRIERPRPAVDMALIRQACWDEQSLLIDYCDLQEQKTRREILPLGLSYSDNAMMLLGWCCLRQDFRIFHVTRIAEARPGPTNFRPRRVALVREYLSGRREACAAQRVLASAI